MKHQAKHWNQRQREWFVKWFITYPRRGSLLVAGTALALVGLGIGLADAVSTTTNLNGGDSLTAACNAATTRSVSVTRPAPLTVKTTCNPRPVTTTTTTKPPATTTTTKPPATTTTTVPPTTTTTTTAPVGGQQCVSGTPKTGNVGLPDPAPAGQDGYLDTADINNSNGYNTYVVNQNNGNVDATFNLCGSSPSHWSIAWSAADAADGGAVQGYPAIQQLYNDWGPDNAPANTPINAGAGVTSISSTFNATNPSDAIGNWEMAYDLWFENYTADVMIWENTSTARGIESSYGGANILNSNVSIGGNSYTLIDYCGESSCPILPSNANNDPELMLVRNTNVNSGTENILADVQWLQANHYLPATEALTQVNFGWEICDSDSQLLTMAVNGYTLTRSPLEPS